MVEFLDKDFNGGRISPWFVYPLFFLIPDQILPYLGCLALHPDPLVLHVSSCFNTHSHCVKYGVIGISLKDVDPILVPWVFSLVVYSNDTSTSPPLSCDTEGGGGDLAVLALDVYHRCPSSIKTAKFSAVISLSSSFVHKPMIPHGYTHIIRCFLV